MNAQNIIGTNESDILLGTEAGERIDALSGNDNISGLGGNDDLRGGLGIDTILGGAGRDTLTGTGSGEFIPERDFLEGGTGSDTIRTGANDVLVFGADIFQDGVHDNDLVQNFSGGRLGTPATQVDFSGFLGAGGSVTSVEQIGNDFSGEVVVGLNSGDTITVPGILEAAQTAFEALF